MTGRRQRFSRLRADTHVAVDTLGAQLSISLRVRMQRKCVRPPAGVRDPRSALFQEHPLRLPPINQHIRLCQELRDLLKGKPSVFLEMTPGFIAYRAAIKHLQGRLLSPLLSSLLPSLPPLSPLPHQSDSLEVLFTSPSAEGRARIRWTLLCTNVSNLPDGAQLYL